MNPLTSSARVLKRYYFHGDVAEGGTWYSARQDAFVPLTEPAVVSPGDIRRLRRQLGRTFTSALVTSEYFRPDAAPNIFTNHPWLKMNVRKLWGLWKKGNHREPLAISPDFGCASQIIGVQ